MNIFNWNKYNSNLILIKKITNYNKKNKFNYLENGLYNHIRDIFCLTLILIFYKKNKGKLNILDYGSNLSTYANLINKINLKNFNFSIYDPFSKKNNIIKKKIKIFNNKKILKKSWDVVNFGSSIQYIDNIDLLNEINFNSTKAILITHTPISLSKSYVTKQLNNKNLNQNIHSFNKIVNFFKKKKFELQFKSRNNNNYISAKKKYKTYSINLLFLKNE
tara:strand:- start:956 stop:1612 length:657 start_codon:yes stop_codon:yes gene_type:complete